MKDWFKTYDNLYAAIAVVRRALPQTYQELIENPTGCELATRVINRLRDEALAEIPYGAVCRGER